MARYGLNKRNVLIAQYKALWALHNVLSHNNKKENEEISTSMVSNLRRDIRLNTLEDTLQLRKDWHSSRKCYHFFKGSTMEYDNHVSYDNNEFFFNEFKRYIKGITTSNELHIKRWSFEHDGEFYNKDTHFLFEDKVYDKDTYQISETTGRLLNLKTDREFKINTPEGQLEGKISLDDGSEFGSFDKYDCLIRIEPNNNKNILPMWLLPSMFVTKNRRFGKGWSVNLNEEELLDMKFKPVEEHKNFFKTITEGSALCNNVTKEEAKGIVRNNINTMCKYKITLGNSFGKANTIAKRLLKRLIIGGLFSGLNIFELKEAIELIQKFFKDEKEVKKYVIEKGYPLG